MAFLDKLGDIARGIGDKTGDAIETAKLNSKIKTEQTAIAECMRQIGEIIYGKHKAGEPVDSGVAELLAAIDGHNGVIAETQAEITRIQAENEKPDAPPAPVGAPTPAVPPPVSGEVICPTCGKANPDGTKFCAECGAKLEAAPPQDRVCPGCGAAVPPTSKFCGECGHRFE